MQTPTAETTTTAEQATTAGEGTRVDTTAGATTITVAIDGPSGSGKSSVSRAVARRFHLRYLDTGATYRALTWWMLQHDIDPGDPEAVTAHTPAPAISVGTDPDRPTVTVDGTDVTTAIRSQPVTAAVSAVSSVPAVRARLTDLQRHIIGPGGIVVEGRDIGTAVAPAAPVKIYLTASVEARAARRNAELTGRDTATVAATRADLRRRDTHDSTRAVSPLAKAADAVEIDATALTFEEVVARISTLVAAAVHHPRTPAGDDEPLRSAR